MPKKKVAILITAITGGGAERVVATLLHELEGEYDFHLVLLHHSIQYALPVDQKIYFLNRSADAEKGLLKLLTLPVYAYKLAKFCKKHNIQTSISFLSRSHIVNGMSRLFGNKAKLIVSERTYVSDYLKSLGRSAARVQKMLIKKYYPKADLIIPNSKLGYIDFKENLGINSEMKVINNPVNIAEIQKLAAEAVDVSFDDFTFIHVANMRREKNYDLLLEAFAMLKDLSCKLILMGKGELETYVSKKISDLDLNSRVILTGRDANPYKYLSRSDCFVLSSSFEGFPNVVLEALACGLPVISTDCRSGPREILAPKTDIRNYLTNEIEMAEYGILTPNYDTAAFAKAMRLLVQDKELASNYRRKAPERAKDFDMKTFSDEFRKVL